MTYIFYRRIISFFIFLCFISSCQTTGNLVLVKRKDLKEIQIKNPSFAEKANEKFPLRTEYQRSDVSKIVIDKEADENLIAFNDSRFISTLPNSQNIIPNIQLTYFLPDTINNNRKDTIKKNINNRDTVLSKPEHKTDTRKVYSLSLIALILNSLATSFSLFTLTKYYFFQSGITIFLGLSLFLSLIGFILALLSKRKIKENDAKYKGKKVSNTALFISLIPFGIMNLHSLVVYCILISMSILWIIGLI